MNENNDTYEIGAYLKDIKVNEPDDLLTSKREKELGTIIQNSKEGKLRTDAINELVEYNLRLVIRIAIKLAHQTQTSRAISIADLVSVGNMGLVRAAKKFKPDFGKFSTYAYFLI